MPSPDAVPVLLKRLPGNDDLPLPAYATAGAAGMDVVSAEDVAIGPGARHPVATGLALAIPAGYEIQVRPRSGLALKHGVTVPNTPGTIDSDYRGELKVILINHGDTTFVIQRGDRIAQLVLAPVVQAQWVEVSELDDTARGAGGFGSTGIGSHGNEKKVCPECGHAFKGNGWDGVDAHWKAKHGDIMSYEKAWPLLRDGTYRAAG